MSTINCTQCKDKIWDYLEGTLTETEQQEIKKHLAECDDCAAEEKEISAIMDGLHGLPLEDVPEDYHAELMDKLEKEMKVVPFKKKTTSKWKPYSLVAAAVLVVAAVGGIGGIQEFQGQVLTAEREPAIEQRQTVDTKADLKTTQKQTAEPKNELKMKPKQAIKSQQPTKLQEEKVIQQKERESVSSPKKEQISQQQTQSVKKVSVPESSNQNISTQPKVLKQQQQERPSMQTVSEAQTVSTNTVEKPMPMNLRMGRDEQSTQSVVLTVPDMKVALDQLHQAGEVLGIWEENAGADFIVFSMKAEQTETFYQKLKEFGEVALPQKAVAGEEPVFVKVSVKVK